MPLSTAILAFTLSSTSLCAIAERPAEPPPPISGVINGQAAMMLWPADAKLAKCEAHLMPLDHQDAEYRYDCGVWFLPPAIGSYKIWAERGDSISQTQTIFAFQGGSNSRGGRILNMSLGPAGEIALSKPHGSDVSLHAANLDTYLAGAPVLSQEFDRRAAADKIRNLKMPAGRILAGLFDVRTNDAIAIARPALLREGRVAYIDPQPPEKGADLFAVLQRPRLRTTAGDDPVKVTLRASGTERAPDVLADDAGGIIAVWYAVPSGNAQLLAQSDRMLFSRDVVLRERRVSTVRGLIQRLPDVHVKVQTSAKAFPESRVVVLDGAKRPLREGELHYLSATLVGISPTAERIRLESAQFSVEQPLDVSAGADREVTFAMTPFTVQGTLYRGDRPVAGDISFETRDKAQNTSADVDGRYAIDLWSPAYYRVRIKSPDIPWTTVRVSLFERDETFDIRLPRTRCTAVAKSKATGQPVPDTKLILMNTYKAESGLDVTSREEAVTDADGVASLPLLRPGNVEVTVLARKGFRQSQQTFPVSDTTQEQAFTIQLEAEDDLKETSIRWPDGTPAAGVELLLWNPRTPAAIVWRGTSDAEGQAMVPAATGAYLLARHLRASAIYPMPEAEVPAVVTLLPAASTLFVKCLKVANSAEPIEIALWVQGVRLTGVAVAFMGGAGYLTNGAWSATGLPITDLRILAFRAKFEPAVLAGHYDALATRINVPSSDTVSIAVVE